MKSLGVGGNLHDGVAQWIERQFAELNVAGSSPVTVAFFIFGQVDKKMGDWPCVGIFAIKLRRSG